MGHVDLSPVTDEALSAVGGETEQVEGRAVLELSEGVVHDVNEWIERGVPLGEGEMGLALASDQGMDLVWAHVTSLAPEARLAVRI